LLQFSLSNGSIIAVLHAIFCGAISSCGRKYRFEDVLALNVEENEKATRQKVTFSFKGE
jgi:hypothetical protein